jgi:hypothetical protein
MAVSGDRGIEALSDKAGGKPNVGDRRSDCDHQMGIRTITFPNRMSANFYWSTRMDCVHNLIRTPQSRDMVERRQRRVMSGRARIALARALLVGMTLAAASLIYLILSSVARN